LQAEVDNFNNNGVNYQIEDINGFYEVNEAQLADGLVKGSPTPSATAAFKAVWEDAVAQAAAAGYDPPDVVCNWAFMWHSAIQGMKEANYAPKALIGWQNGVAEDWAEAIGTNGANNTTWHDGVHAMGVGQWHKAMSFTDPFYGSNFAAATSFETAYSRTLDYNTAGCLAAGIVVWRALSTQAGGGFNGQSDATKRATLKTALKSFNEETMWGTVRFNTYNQNSGRGTAAWQIQMESGSPAQKCVLPLDSAEVEWQLPFATWQALLLASHNASPLAHANLECPPSYTRLRAVRIPPLVGPSRQGGGLER
jgi:hypothetical protein